MAKVASPVRRLVTAIFGVVLSTTTLGFTLVPQAHATTSEYQQCAVNSSCTVGEFLYNDDATPLTGAACSLTSRKPDGTLFINAASMTGATDGWYSYEVNTASAVEGLYRGTICCTPPGEDVMCIERSFEVGPAALNAQDVEDAVWDATRSAHDTTGTFGENLQNPSSISIADIWNYPSRSLTTFGSLVGDIWSNSARNLTGFGDLVSSIWGNSSRSLNTNSLGDEKYLMTKEDAAALTSSISTITNNSTTTNQTTITYNTLTQQLAETKTLLEKIVNEPTVETFISDTPGEDLNTKIQHTEQTLLSLQDHVARASNSTDLVLLTWNSVDPAKISEGLDSTIQLLGRNVDTVYPGTILDETQSLSDIWGSYQMTSTVDQAKAALVSAIKTRNELKIDGKTAATRKELEETAKFVTMLKTLVGSQDDTYTKATSFGFLRDVQKKAEAFDQQNKTINGLLSSWDDSSETERDQLLATVSREVHSVNTVPNAELITTPIKEAATPELKQKNMTYGLKALIGANERLLAKGPTGLINLVWFEEGSVVFRFMATNPSTTTVQKVNISYALPYETERDTIMSYDPVFNIKYNPETSSYVLDGTVTLQPSETKTYAVEVIDVWKIPQEQLDSLQKEADGLYDGLKRTSFTAQASTLKTNIDTGIADITENQSNSNMPDARIRAYRENQLSLVEIKQDVANLGMLATSSSATKTAFGFVGGIQVIILWAMVIVLMAGFIYLALYTHAIRIKFRQQKTSGHTEKKSPHSTVPIWKRAVLALLLSTVATTSTAAFGSALLAKQGLDKAQTIASNQYPTVLGTSVIEPEKSVLLGSADPVVIYSSPDETSQIYHKIPEDIFVITKAKSKNWVQIQYTWGGLVYIGWVQDSQIKGIQE